MVIQCEQCSTKFRLDDSRVTGKGVKVRCAKCRHVFSVRKETPDTEMQTDLDAMLEAQNPDFGAMLDKKVSIPTEQESLPKPELQKQDSPLPTSDDLDDMFTEPNPDFGAMFDDSPSIATAQESLPQTVLKQEDTPTPSSSIPDFDYSDFDFAGKENVPDSTLLKPSQEEPLPSSAPDNDEFALFSLDEEQGLALKHKETYDEPASAPPYNLGDVDMDRPVAEPPPTGMEFSDSFDFGSFQASTPSADSPVALPENDEAKDYGFPAASDEKEAVVFSGDDIESFTVVPEVVEAVDSKTVPSAPVEEVQAAPVVTEAVTQIMEPSQNMPQIQEEELPPLTIASRRKQSTLLGTLIAMAAVVVVAAVGFFGYTQYMEDKGKVAADTGKIRINAVNASFMANQSAGELLVITGEAVNGYSKPRAAIQVKGMVYGANGEILTSKNAYCGNPLTKEQLSTLSIDKIDSAMANQFGDSLANMEVPAGKAIPFVIVIPKPPKDGKDYGVEPVGSTVAAGKQ
ncbi:MAG: DUF3426 domain-containing protein [Deltaproteobacteria bacterium]